MNVNTSKFRTSTQSTMIPPVDTWWSKSNLSVPPSFSSGVGVVTAWPKESVVVFVLKGVSIFVSSHTSFVVVIGQSLVTNFITADFNAVLSWGFKCLLELTTSTGIPSKSLCVLDPTKRLICVPEGIPSSLHWTGSEPLMNQCSCLRCRSFK